MNPSEQIGQNAAVAQTHDESAVAVLQHLNAERGKMFTESDYREMRGAVLDELAHGARMRGFTVFTFAFIALGLLGLSVVGLAAIRDTGDYTLLIASIAALVALLCFFWNLSRGIQSDACRTLGTRLDEINQLRQQGLVTEDEFTEIQAHILMARQRASRPQDSRRR